MEHEKMVRGLVARRRYREAKSWQKPWLDPARFLRNQARKRRLIELLISLRFRPWELAAGIFRLHQPLEVYPYDNLVFAPVDAGLSRC